MLLRLTATSYVNCPTLNKIFCWFTRNNEQLEIFTRDFFLVSARALRTARHRITGGVTRDIIVTRLPNNWLSTTLNRHSHCFPTTKLPNSPHILHACMEKAPSPISVNITSFIVKLAEKIRAKLEFFKQALRGSTLPSAVSFSSLWILQTPSLA